MKKFKKLFLSFLFFSFCVAFSFAQINTVKKDMSDCPVGIFVNGKIIPPLKYSKIKAGKGAWLSGLTYGAAKASNYLEFKGATSFTRVAVGDTIIFKFGDVPAKYLSEMWEFDASKTPNSFGIGKFKAKSDKRELKTASVSIWTGVDMGTKETSDVKLDLVKQEGTDYIFVVSEAKPGEYCIMFNENASGGYLPVFDFTVRK